MIHQGDYGTGEDVLMVEMTVDREYVAIHLVNALLVIIAKSLAGLEGEVKLCSWLKINDLLLELVERHAEAADEDEGIALLSLLFEMLLAVFVDRIELIAHRNVLVLLVVHCEV